MPQACPTYALLCAADDIEEMVQATKHALQQCCLQASTTTENHANNVLTMVIDRQLP